MKSKWLDYYKEFPHLYCLAIILDPAVKLNGLYTLLTYYYEALAIPFDINNYVNECKTILEELHNHYAAQTNTSIPSHRVSESMASRFDPFIADLLFKKQKTATGASSSTSSTNSEVNEYLTHHFETEYNFNILTWWKSKQNVFPILARIAKDILAVPASTVASESAFSAGRRVLDEKRSRLAPDSIEMCVCKKDWDQAEKRTQGMRDDDDDDEDPWMIMNTSSSNVSTNPSPVVEDLEELTDEEDEY